jgi:hypothetical protein
MTQMGTDKRKRVTAGEDVVVPSSALSSMPRLICVIREICGSSSYLATAAVEARVK